jgi:hypothetical protein
MLRFREHSAQTSEGAPALSADRPKRVEVVAARNTEEPTASYSCMKGVLALVSTCGLVAVCAARLVTGRSLASALQAFGIGCFAIMAATHVFEEFSLLPALGWGRPESVGHFIDLTAALLGVALVAASFLLRGHR